MELYHQDGTCRLLEVSGFPVFNVHGEIERIESIFRDIQDKSKADEKLEQTRNSYENWIKKAKIEIKHLRKQFFDIVDFYSIFLKIRFSYFSYPQQMTGFWDL